MNKLRNLPSVDRVLNDMRLSQARAELGPTVLTEAIREELESQRKAIQAGGTVTDLDELIESAARRAYESIKASLEPVINATGVIIHTNLGRAPLSEDALAAVAAVSRGYSNLEFDLTGGARGSRHQHVEALIRRLTGAEAAMAVNNNASALLLALSALAPSKEVIISRGQLVEIGGGFRIPDVMAQSGARMVEVGTTNRTYIADYERAITEETVAVMRVHTSNYRVMGFVHSVELAELVALARSRGVLALDDLGSGCLLDTTSFGLMKEPTPQESLAAAADLVMFSGDKLLGGPQAGIIAGKAAIIDRLRRHPLARAVRLDKLSIAALTATLLHYVRGDAIDRVPVWQMISASLNDLNLRAEAWQRVFGPSAVVVDGRSMVGGGSLPEESLPSRVLSITPPGGGVEALATLLRSQEPPIIGRVEQERLLLDPRTVQPREDHLLSKALAGIQDRI